MCYREAYVARMFAFYDISNDWPRLFISFVKPHMYNEQAPDTQKDIISLVALIVETCLHPPFI
jgi:hypothetical protein